MKEDPENGVSSGLQSQTKTMPKVEILDLDLPLPRGEMASSSGSNIRSSLIGMGFSPSLVDKAIEEKGEDTIELLVDTLFEYTALRDASSDSLDSLDSMFDDHKDTSSSRIITPDTCLKEEPDELIEANDGKKTSLMMMNFSSEEVEFALDKLGEDAPISELVDFIFAAQIARDSENIIHDQSRVDAVDEAGNETLRLLEMGFSEQEISTAIEKYGSEVPIERLADSIVADQCSAKYKNNASSSFGMNGVTVKTEENGTDNVPQFRDTNFAVNYKGKRPKEESFDESSSMKRPKEEYTDDFNGYPTGKTTKGNGKSTDFWTSSQHKAGNVDKFGTGNISKPKSCKSLDQMVAKLPYFFYGNVMNLSQDSWSKISQFLYAIEPEFVNTQFFSALSRKEGYVHNLPKENRFHILPKPPMTIEEAIPSTKSYWPSWDTRKQLSCISSETSGNSHLCGRLERMLIESKGLLSVEQQRDLLHQCRTLNLVWVGTHKLAPIEPEHIERILGYPSHHTRVTEFTPTERLQSLKHCFQTDTLGYHLSVLKSLFPDGMTVLSIYSGIGGAEMTLHRLGISLKAVVSVEPCDANRKILRRWWQSSEQAGELVQIEDIQKLASSKLEGLVKRFGNFDFVVCQNPYSYSSKCSNVASAESDSFAGLDFSMFYEFVRVLQGVRSTIQRTG